MPAVCAGDYVGVDVVLGALSALAVEGEVWLGAKPHAFFKARGREASGDVNA